jgi:AmiR/NasT family two-component response regulator
VTEQRLIQNFRHSRGVLWAGADLATDTLEKTLAKLGVTLTRIEQIDATTLDFNRDILLVDGDTLLDPGLILRSGTLLPPAPAIGLVGVEAPSRLKVLAEIGVTAFLRKPVHAAAVYSSLFFAVNSYRRLRAMELRVADHDRRRRGRPFVIKAVVNLVQTRGLSDDDAYALLRRESMRLRVGIEDYCEAFLRQQGGKLPGNRVFPPATTGLQPTAQENGDATSFDDGRSEYRNDRDAGTDSGTSGRPDQARRA